MRKLFTLLTIGMLYTASAQCDTPETNAFEDASQEKNATTESLYKLYKETNPKCFYWKRNEPQTKKEYTVVFVDGWWEDYYSVRKRIKTKQSETLSTGSKTAESGYVEWKGYYGRIFKRSISTTYSEWEEVAKEGTPDQAEKALKLIKRHD